MDMFVCRHSPPPVASNFSSRGESVSPFPGSEEGPDFSCSKYELESEDLKQMWRLVGHCGVLAV